jgi:hypothetical protein
MFIEVLVRRVTTPRLEKLDLDFFKYPTVSIPSLLQFMNTLAPQVRQRQVRVSSKTGFI